MLVQPLFQAVQQGVHFDKVITTQSEFEEALKSSDTYPNGVLIDGDNLTFSNHIGSLDGNGTGVLVFSQRTKISFDLTLTGTSMSSIAFENFGQVYSFCPEGSLRLLDSTFSGSSGYFCSIFYSCKNLYNIIITLGQNTQPILNKVNVFLNCDNLVNSKVVGILLGGDSTDFSPFRGCNLLVNCQTSYGTMGMGGYNYGFISCTKLSNCQAYFAGFSYEKNIGFCNCISVSLSCSGTMSNCTGEIPIGYTISCKGQINY